ncbi:MAG TPA: glycosyltransferase family 4 protein [Acidimicrobiia bacterium]|nr:glycosyltransferase family 4 protein [Acidimicrobiia bacterium]
MRVAVVSPYAFDEPGGVQDQVTRIVAWLRGAGHEAWAVAPGAGGPEGTRHVGRYRTVPTNRSRAPVAIDPRVARRVARAVADADVVHLHEPFMPMVSLGTLSAAAPPIVATFHANPEGAARRVYRLARPLLRRLGGRIAVATAVSAVAAAAVEGVVSVRIIPNGIDLEDYRPGDDPPSRAGVLFIGRDEPRKGLDVLLQAWPLIRSRHPGVELTVAGAVRESGPEGVTFLGRVADERKRELLASASVLAVPNLGGESFGIVGLEGLASGCVVVASDLDAFRAVCADAALYARAGDPVDLAAAVNSLLSDPSLRADLGARALRRSRQFGRGVVLGAYLLAYEDALAARR